MIADRMKELRKEKGISQAQMAENLKISQTAYWKYEAGKAEPDISTIMYLCDLYGVTSDYLIGRTNVKDINENSTPEDVEQSLITAVSAVSEPQFGSEEFDKAVQSAVLKLFGRLGQPLPDYEQ